MFSPPIVSLPKELAREIRNDIRRKEAFSSPSSAKAKLSLLRPMPVLDLRIGTKGGLPFEFLSRDIYSGCLPLSSVCYGNCPQALLTVENGYDFGDRKLNRFDEALINEDLALLDPAQRWIRQGWNSDVSFAAVGWQRARDLAMLIFSHGRLTVLLSKIFSLPSRSILLDLARIKVEIRVSISALDHDLALRRRLEFLISYREAGGPAIPYLMTTVFAHPVLVRRQLDLVNWIVAHDLPGAEHPLRLNSTNPLQRYIDGGSGFPHPKFPEQAWFGSLYPEDLLIPPPPSLLASYAGLGETYQSRIDWAEVSHHFDRGIPLNADLVSGKADLAHPNLHKHGTLSM